MNDDNEKGDMKSGFEGKTAHNAPALTEAERERKGLEVIEALDRLREEALKNGLTPEIATEILEEYYAEKRAAKDASLTKEKSGDA